MTAVGSKINGNMKYVTLGALLALVAGGISYGAFYGKVGSDMRHNAEAIKAQSDRCNVTNAEFRRKFEVVQQKTFEQYQKIEDKIDDLARRIP